MSSEVSWEEENDVREVIADIRDADCDLSWVVFGYKSGHVKVISVIAAGSDGLAELRTNLDPNQVMFAFIQLEERAFAFIHWCPDAANGVSRARASIHKSFVTNFLGNLAIDLQARCLEDLTDEKINEEMRYFYSTSGRQLDALEAEKKRREEENRKKESAKRQALAGNTHEAQKRLARLLPAASSSESKILPKASGTNVSMKAPPKHLSSTLFEKAKVSVELDDEENLKELMLDLREADINGDFNWMILSYAEDKKNTLALLETGNGGRKGLAEYLQTDHDGASDKVLYLLIKEDDSSNKCTFVCWIGPGVPAMFKASASTHRGAISKWMSSVIHNLKEEYVESVNDLLGIKETSSPLKDANSSMLEGQSGLNEVERKIQNMPYAGKVLDEVKRDKTPQELWMERKQGRIDTPSPARRQFSNERMNSESSSVDSSVDPEKEFTQIQLKSRVKSSCGRSKYAKKADGSPMVRGSEGSGDVAKMSRSELQAAAQLAATEAKLLEEEAAAKRQAALKLQHAAMLADGMAGQTGSSDDEASHGASGDEGGSAGGCPEGSVVGPGSASSPEEQPALRDDVDVDPSPSASVARPAHAAGAGAGAGAAHSPPRADGASMNGARSDAPLPSAHGAGAPTRGGGKEEHGHDSRGDGESRAASSGSRGEARVPSSEARAPSSGSRSATEESAEYPPPSRSGPRTLVSDIWRQESPEKSPRTSPCEVAREGAGNNHNVQVLRSTSDQSPPARVSSKESVPAAAAPSPPPTTAEVRRSPSQESVGSVKGGAGPAETDWRRGAAHAAEGPPMAAGAREPHGSPEVARTDHMRLPMGGTSAVNGEKSGPHAHDSRQDTATRVSAPVPAAADEAPSKAEDNRPSSASQSHDDLRRKAEELLARKKALLEEAARSRATAGSERERVALGDLPDNADQDRLKRAEEFRQRKLAELAARRGVDSDASSKKAAFLREAEEVVRRAALQEATRKLAEQDRRSAV
mmetsp:Transcript_10200/g.29262  ORF Transcript_10200/g.29262 Transcript_10200/m.29262 type:complete len:985 (-) Transcript_10200:35-2989(-)